jgi:hypothetical protein
MDLNRPPPEFDYDFLDAIFQDLTDACDPIFCIQQLPNQQDVPTVRLLLEAARIEDVPGPSNGDDQLAAGNGTVQIIPDKLGEEVMSTPQIPFIGQTFGTQVKRGSITTYMLRE